MRVFKTAVYIIVKFGEVVLAVFLLFLIPKITDPIVFTGLNFTYSLPHCVKFLMAVGRKIVIICEAVFYSAHLIL